MSVKPSPGAKFSGSEYFKVNSAFLSVAVGSMGREPFESPFCPLKEKVPPPVFVVVNVYG